jgi:tetrahydromethanopterin S-methyltransferase subunit G
VELDARKLAISAAHERWKEAPESSRRTMTIDFQGQSLVLPVITINPAVALLNHDNYRLAAQLQDHPDREKIYSAPLSVSSQESLAKLLSQTDDFKKLKQQLADLDQKEPGLITADGLLVNGNTRTVALRQLGSTGLMVGLLPTTVSNEDVLDLQVQLQMVVLVHQAYSYTNQLLLIEKIGELHGDDDAIIRRLGKKPSKTTRAELSQQRRILRLIREIRDLHQGAKLPYSAFDGKSELLQNLDRDYEEQKSIDFVEAENLKWTRVGAMFFDLTKDQVRSIKSTFAITQLGDEPKKTILQSATGASTAGVFGETPRATDAAAIKQFVTKVVNARFDQTGREVPIEDKSLVEVGKEMQVAAEQLINIGRLEKMLSDPIKHFTQARKNFDEVATRFDELSRESNFDLASFESEYAKVKAVLDKIDKKIKEIRG